MRALLRENTRPGWKHIFSLRKYGTIVEYEFLSFWRTKSESFNNLLWLPILDPLFFGAGISSFAPKDSSIFGTTSYLAFICPGIVGLSFFRTFSHVIYRMTMDRRHGLQGFKLGTGVGMMGYILGNLTLPLITSVLQAIITMGVLVFLSTPMGSINNVLLMLAACTISTLFWSTLATLLSFSFKSYTKRDIFISITMLPITLASPAFYPLQNVPTYLQVVSRFNPLTYNIIAMRDAFLYGYLRSEFFFTVFLALILLVWTTILVSKSEFLSSRA